MDFDQMTPVECEIENRLNEFGATLRWDTEREGYAIFDASMNIPILGWDFDLSLEDVAEWIDAPAEAA